MRAKPAPDRVLTKAVRSAADRPGMRNRELSAHPVRVLVVGALLLPLAACADAGEAPAPHPTPPNTISFAVFGDAPYTAPAERQVDVLLGDIAAVAPDFLLHVGDIDGDRCTDGSYEERRRQLERLPASVPVVYTPGDNEWTDCHRRGMDPLERLASLRRVFFAGEWAAGNRRLPGFVTQDSADGLPYPEHARFELGSVVVATVNIVGSENGVARFRGRTARHDSAVEARTAAAVSWVGSAFERARELASPVVVIAFHGAPFDDDPFAPFIAALADGAGSAAGWGGEVLLVHGDWHELTWDRPLPLENVRRLQTFGEPDIGWVHVVVDTTAAEPITIRPYLCGGRVRAWLRLGMPAHCEAIEAPSDQGS